ncbi:hypothetical protein [Saccharothrix syringae]|uniref:Uncharacterized protein n=1 Tax=Saccharothrix syringae TaxID=103733 RepID=A0A5Q0HD97_SACSY|nr:hypothetical protein [Saccharothrix syringae]QFZ23810.1 hypothetical protein EKG83_45885 [Saccharothrix syringae]
MGGAARGVRGGRRGDRAVPGHRRAPADAPWFTTAYFHRPDEVAGEAAEAGFEAVGTFALDSTAWMLPNADLEAIYADLAHFEYLMWALREVEREESAPGASAHLPALGRRPAE